MMDPAARNHLGEERRAAIHCRSGRRPSGADAPRLHETAVKGSNGFVCAVERAWMSQYDFPQFWNPHMRGPLCYNPAAVRSILPYTLKRTEWVLAGRSKPEIIAATKEAIATHALPPLESGAMTYMMSRQQYLNDGAHNWVPHLMFYFPRAQAGAWGADLPGAPPMLNEQFLDSPESLSVLMVPVTHWSDGTRPLPQDGVNGGPVRATSATSGAAARHTRGSPCPVDPDGPARRRRGLHVMLVSTEAVRDIPVVHRCSGHGRAPLHVLRINRARRVAIHVCSHRRATDCADARRPILTAATSDLMAKDAADDASHDRARHIDTRRTAVHNLTLDPASLLRRPHDCARRGHGCLVQRLIVATPVVIGRRSRETLGLIRLSLRFHRLHLCRGGILLGDVGLHTRVGCRALRGERCLLAAKARHVLRRDGALVREYGELVHAVVLPAVDAARSSARWSVAAASANSAGAYVAT